MVLQVAYVGNRGERLYTGLDLNQVNAAPILPQFLTMQANVKAGCAPAGTGCPAGVTGQSIPLVNSGILTAAFVNSSATITDLSQNAAGNFAGRIEQTTMAAHLRPNQQFSSAVYFSNSADSVYHSLQTTLRKRFAQGYMFNLAYTFSKVIDNHSSDPWSNNVPTSNSSGVIDAHNIAAERAPANFDRTHSFTMTWIYELPFGNGRHWVSNPSKLVDALVGGWNIQGLNTLMTGSPFSVSSGVSTALFGANSRAVVVGDMPDTSLKTKAGAIGPVYFPNASAFGIAAPGTTGMGRNMFRGAGYWGLDTSLSKSFVLTEKAKATFRLEAFNALNHSNYRGLGSTTVGSTSILSPNFGTACCQTLNTSSSTNIVPIGESYRVMQAVLKLSF
jgi:hypothetical protein